MPSSVHDFIQDNARPLAELVGRRLVPLHDPATMQQHRMIPRLLRSPKGPQGHIVTGAAKALKRQKDVVFANAPGTGKTFMSLGTAHCHANGKPYSVLITCPPHLTEKWEREIRLTIPDPIVFHVDKWKEWLALSACRHNQLRKPTFFIAAISKAKLGASWVPAAIYSNRLGGFTCPQCYKLVMANRIHRADTAWLSASKKFCQHCGSALWQSQGKRYEGSRIAKDRWKGLLDYLIADESHNQKSAFTLAGDSLGHFIAAAKKVMLLTGTLIAGKSEDLRPTYYRLVGQRFKDRGLEWNGAIDFARKYGRMESVITERTTEVDGKVLSAKKSTYRKVRPGIMPGLYSDFIADRTLFLSLKQMGEALPKLSEEAVGIDMPPDMAAEYHHMKHVLVSKFNSLLREHRITAMRFLSAVAEALMTWPDDPDGWGSIGYKDIDGIRHEVYLPRPLSTVSHPKESHILEMVKAEKKEGRQCWVFSTRNDTSDRIHRLLQRNGLSVNRMTAGIKAEIREQWIGENAPGVDVIISHPKLVETGLDLFSPGYGKHGRPYNMCTLIWAATGLELNTLRQASARHWRIGQTLECRTRFLYYRNTAQQNALTTMAKKLLAAEFLEGNLEGAGLIEEATEASMELAIVRQLAAGIQSDVPQFTTVA